ncbi:hypothetical protein F66182_16413 [Fusarium sp. NRRL 66182]|nr:hypothetical protein F66182_16413 [Fusarium sp. NRRL 66182]
MTNFSRPYAKPQPPHIARTIAFNFLRFSQFALALTVAGLYGVDLNHAHQKNVYIDAKWVYAEVVAALAAFTSAVYLVIWCCVQRQARNARALTPFNSTNLLLWLWDVFMWLIWLTLFGIFGNMYLPENPEGDAGIERMKHAVWVDLVNLLLWTVTMVWTGLKWWKGGIEKNKEGNSSEMTKESNIYGVGAGGRVSPPVASGAAPLAMPNPTSYEMRSAPSDAPQHDVSPMVSRQNSNVNANTYNQGRAVSPL